MLIKINEIPNEGLNLNYIEDPDNLDLGKGVRTEEGISVNVKVTKYENIISVAGRIGGTLIMECSRCLKEFPYSINPSFHINYTPVEEFNKEEHELKKEDLDINFYSGESIEITDLVVEQILLATSIKPLCKQDCLGLCPRCGKDLNTGRCTCEVARETPFSTAFKDFLKKE